MAALIADFATLVAVSLASLVIRVGLDAELLAFPLFMGLVVASFATLRAVAWWWPEPFGRFFDRRDPEALGVRFAMAMVLGGAGLAAALGIEPALGAFLAGTGVATVFRSRGELDHTLDGLAYGFLIPIFFIGVGLSFSLTAVSDPGAIAFVALLVAVAFGVKLVPSIAVLGRRHGLRSGAAAGMLLSARLSLIIVVARIGVELGVIQPTLEAVIILLAALRAPSRQSGTGSSDSPAAGARTRRRAEQTACNDRSPAGRGKHSEPCAAWVRGDASTCPRGVGYHGHR